MTSRFPTRRLALAVALLASAVLTLGTAGCKKPPAAKIAANTPSDWSSLTIPTKGVSFSAPPDWRVGPLPEGVHYSMVADEKGSNVTFVVAPRDVKDADQLLTIMTPELGGPGKTVTGDIVEMNGARCSRMWVESTTAGIPMKMVQYGVVADKKVCFVTYAAARDRFDVHAKQAEQVAASVKVQ